MMELGQIWFLLCNRITGAVLYWNMFFSYMISGYFLTTESFFRSVMGILSFSLGPKCCILLACLDKIKTIL